VLQIGDSQSASVAVKVLQNSVSGRSPKLVATLYDSEGKVVATKDLVINIEKPKPPQLVFNVKGEDGQITISTVGSQVFGEKNDIEETCAALYWGGEYLGSWCEDGKTITLHPPIDGVYRVKIWVVDEHGISSVSQESAVLVPPEKGKAPEIIVNSPVITCYTGRPCHIDATETYRKAKQYGLDIDLGYYDEEGRLVASGPECDIVFSKEGQYTVVIKEELLGKEEVDDVKETKVIVYVF